MRILLLVCLLLVKSGAAIYAYHPEMSDLSKFKEVSFLLTGTREVKTFSSKQEFFREVKSSQCNVFLVSPYLFPVENVQYYNTYPVTYNKLVLLSSRSNFSKIATLRHRTTIAQSRKEIEDGFGVLMTSNKFRLLVEDLETLAYFLDKPSWGVDAVLLYETQLPLFRKYYNGPSLSTTLAKWKTVEISAYVSKSCGEWLRKRVETKTPISITLSQDK